MRFKKNTPILVILVILISFGVGTASAGVVIPTITLDGNTEVTGTLTAPDYFDSSNTRAGIDSTAIGGFDNSAVAHYSTIGGGFTNIASESHSTIGGGNSNTADGEESTIGGGSLNIAIGDQSTIGGGQNNSANQDGSFIGGGSGNIASGLNSVIGGGIANTASGIQSTISGGNFNQASATGTFIGSGFNNIASNFDATIGGGSDNTASGGLSTVGGGFVNTASGEASTVSGGQQNLSDGQYSTIGGGISNHAGVGSESATIGGGNNNSATGDYSTVPGGKDNVAIGTGSFAAGSLSTAFHDGSTVFNDNSGVPFESTVANQFSIQATNGVRILGNLDVTGSITDFSAGPGITYIPKRVNFFTPDQPAVSEIKRITIVNNYPERGPITVDGFSTAVDFTSCALTRICFDGMCGAIVDTYVEVGIGPAGPLLCTYNNMFFNSGVGFISGNEILIGADPAFVFDGSFHISYVYQEEVFANTLLPTGNNANPITVTYSAATIPVDYGKP